MTKKSRNYYDSNISIITAPRGLAKISIIEDDLRYDYDAISTNNHGYRKDAVRTNKVEGPEKWRRDSSERKAIIKRPRVFQHSNILILFLIKFK